MGSNRDTFERVKEAGIIAAIRTSNPQEAVKAAAAIRAGGIPIIEVSLAPQNALDVLDAVATAHSQSIIMGAGTVVDAEGVRQAALAGARFIVTPGFSAEAVAKAKEFGLAVFAGAMTPTEVQLASASGADAVKLFPCFATGGARYLKALRGQYPATEFIASGGIGLDNCEEYIRAGACAIGVGGEIADFESMAAGSFNILTVRTKRLRDAIRNARGLKESLSFNIGEGR
jgi:2-dehydro-3-deoxyphosphogluconate aldolase/(4S)-4-hydroxy-2-oxoglutarate aldolase